MGTGTADGASPRFLHGRKGTFYFILPSGLGMFARCQEHRERHRVDTFIMSSIEEMVEPMFSTKTMTLPPLSH